MDASHDPAGPPNYYNSFERSVYPPTDGTVNVSSFTSFAGGSPLGLRSASENNVQEHLWHARMHQVYMFFWNRIPECLQM